MLYLTDPKSAATFLAITLLIYPIFISIWRLYFHPLRRFPGPKLAALTNQYMVYQTWKGRGHLNMHELHERYGDFVRYGPDKLSVNSAAAIPALYGSGAAVSKSSLYETMAHGAYNILTLRDKKMHAIRRRTMSQGFSEQALRMYEPTILRGIEKFCAQIDHSITRAAHMSPETWSEPMDMSLWCNYIFFDIMTNVIFGQDFNLIGCENHRDIPAAIEDSNWRMSILLVDKKWKTAGIDKILFPRSINGRQKFLHFVSSLIKKRVQRGTDSTKDVFSILSHAKDPESQECLTPKQITAESVTLIVAGADTTSTAFATLLFYLSRHPAIYARVADEVRRNFTSDSVNSGNGLNACVLLRACIQESMRISPPIGGPMWREVTGDSLTIDGQAIPKGCDIGTPAYAFHHRPDLFPEPYSFLPERWLQASEDIVNKGSSPQKADSANFLAFSSGSRGCIGRSLATKEMMLLAATILLRYDFRTAEGDTGMLGAGSHLFPKGRQRPMEYQLYEHVTSSKMGPSLQFHCRRQDTS